MERDVHVCRCPFILQDCAVVTGGGYQHKPALRPIPVERPFQKIGVDIMDLPCTERGNKHVVFQDMLTKWPMVFPVPDQKTKRLVRLLCEEVVPMYGVPEALLSDRGANLLSHLMQDVCSILGIEKLNTTAYHPECDGMVERFNRTLKTMLRKRAAQFGAQWDNHLPGLLWAYRKAPHDSTGDKPSFLLFGWDCRSPVEASLLRVNEDMSYTTVADYREELVLTLSTARQTALETIGKAQKRYKAQYDRHTDNYQFKIGDWILIRFPSEETGRLRKLSRPWHGLYRVKTCNDTNVTATKVYFPLDQPVHVHQNRVKPCPEGFTPGYYWYGGRRRGPGSPPRWVEAVLAGEDTPRPNPQSSESLGSIFDERAKYLLPSLLDDSQSDTQPSGFNSLTPGLPDQSGEPDVARGTEATLSGSEDIAEVENKAVRDNSPQVHKQPSRYSLRTSRCPPERYG